MKPKKFITKLWLYFMLFAAVIFTVLWLLQTVFLQSFYNDMLIRNTRKAARTIVSNSSDESITQIIDELTFNNSILVFVTDTQGEIIYSSDEYKGARQKDRTIADDKINDQRAAGEKGKRNVGYRNLPEGFDDFLKVLSQSESLPIEVTSDRMYIYGDYVDYYDSDEPSVLYVSTTLDAVGSAVYIIRVQLAWVTALSLVFGFILSWFLAKSFSDPVAQLSQKAKQLGEKDYPKAFKQGFCTELDVLSDNLDRTSEKLIESRSFQNELLANVSHDLRTPLTMIKGYAEVIKDTSWDDGEQCAADIAVIVRETNRLSELVNEILEYSEMKVGEKPLDFEKTDLSAVINKVTESFKVLNKHKDKTIEAEIEEGIFVNGSVLKLERAVYNLIDNAFRHTSQGGGVEVSLHSENGKAIIEVTDHGDGIPEKEFEHIWNRYYTFRQRGGKGTSGLGLSIVKQIVDIHAGICSVESTVGEGSTFRITLDEC